MATLESLANEINALNARFNAFSVVNGTLQGTNGTNGTDGDSGAINANGIFNTHLLPGTNNTYDIGSADKKIRDLYVSDNSIWIGESHKINITGGKAKFKKRKGGKPNSITTQVEYLNGKTEEDMSLHDWIQYKQEQDGGNPTAEDVFSENDFDDEETILTNGNSLETEIANIKADIVAIKAHVGL